MKYTKEDLERMGYKRIAIGLQGICYENKKDGKRIVLRLDQKDGKYEWVGIW